MSHEQNRLREFFMTHENLERADEFVSHFASVLIDSTLFPVLIQLFNKHIRFLHVFKYLLMTFVKQIIKSYNLIFRNYLVYSLSLPRLINFFQIENDIIFIKLCLITYSNIYSNSNIYRILDTASQELLSN